MAIIFIIVGLIITILSSMGNMYPPLGRNLTQAMNLTVPNNIPDLFTLIELNLKGKLDDIEYFSYGQKLGFSEFFLQHIRGASVHVLPISDLISLYYRGIIDRHNLEFELEKHKVEHDNIDYYIKALEYIPGVQDLIRFAVREVYHPEQIKEFGLSEDFPVQFAEEAAKLGLNPDNALKYWQAHWQLPSIQMGYEMLHRRVISDEQLNSLMKALDIVPKWRDYLKQISYKVLTRVDVRRMYRLGVLSDKDVYENYLDQGYSPKNAELMTLFTIEYESNEDDGLTRSSLIDGFKKGIITIDELRQLLGVLRYAESTIEYYVSLAVYEKTKEYVEDYTNDLIENYKLGIMTTDQIRNDLLKLDLPTTYIDELVNKLLRKKALKYKTIDKETLEKWLKLQIIGETEYINNMKLIGYSDNNIQHFLTEIEDTGQEIVRKYLPLSTYTRWYTKGLLSEDDFIQILYELSYSEDDIETIIFEAQEKIIAITEGT